MKKVMHIFLILIAVIISGCYSPAKSDNMPVSTQTPTDKISPKADITDSNAKTYYFDVEKEWDADKYEQKHGQDLYYFSAPILSPYKYTYNCEDKNMTIKEIANALGKIMMDDFMLDYEGKSFTVTEYHNLTAYVKNETQLQEWIDIYCKRMDNVIILDNQWICTFSCDYKYSGIYCNIGEMPKDIDWFHIMGTDGSGENHVFLIQRIIDSEYAMRALPKTVKELYIP